LAIAVMLKFLKTLGFLPYIIYRIVLGIALIFWTVI
jgi:undecaprenyl pyrophosphate phosphatase UppP